MLLAYRGSVNRWECDENDHLNVRFYVEKHWQTLSAGIGSLGLQPQFTAAQLPRQLAMHHLRFLQESRLAAPLSGYVGVVQAGPEHLDVLTELRQSFTDAPLSACVHRLTGASAPVSATLPAHASPRGVADADLAYSDLMLDQADSHGFKTIGMGLAGSDECTSDGMLRVHNYMARISDAMPHLWGLLRSDAGELDANEGGAVLEYRLRYHRALRSGQRFVLTSGVSAVSAKVQRFAHLLFNADDGSICLSAEAAGVRMDLVERRAKVLSADMQRQMTRRLLRPFVI